ncbi:MAG: YcgL domain-containing protein [Gammaproteobacteria bacterium]|nr:YcgL domain-containing protein [Gammaproteobacteria bacterium]
MKIKSYIYKSLKKQDSYLYLIEKDKFDCLPYDLTKLLGKLEFIMPLDLDEHRHLAQADVLHVIEKLSNQGYYVQLPKTPLSSITTYSISG